MVQRIKPYELSIGINPARLRHSGGHCNNPKCLLDHFVLAIGITSEYLSPPYITDLQCRIEIMMAPNQINFEF